MPQPGAWARYWPWAFVTLAPLLAVAAALVSQHHFDMQPCPWCTLQRLLFLCIAMLGAIGWFAGAMSRAPASGPTGPTGKVSGFGPWPARALGGTAAVFCLAGAAAALWQHHVAAATSSCKLTLADRIINGLGLDERWPQLFAAYASCAEAAVSLLGLPYAYWSLVLFALLLSASLKLAFRPAYLPQRSLFGR